MKKIYNLRDEIGQIKEDFQNLDESVRSKKYSKARIFSEKLDKLREKINKKEMKNA